jgi:hypothetical protein
MKPIQLLSRNIAKNTILTNKKIYFITQEVRVRPGVVLTIQDGATLYLMNGIVRNSKIKRTALIFEQGSKLRAKKFSLRAANSEGKPEKLANNGGIWFCGNHRSASKDSISIKCNPKKRFSKFNADEIKTFYLGRLDSNQKTFSKKIRQSLKRGDDIDGISILGVGRNEWNINSLKSYYSGDGGIDLTNSDIQLDSVYVKDPTEDGLDVRSSRIQIKKSLTISLGSGGSDRDLFDLEADDGAAYVEINKGCRLNLNGVFGDELILSSKDMPPIRRAKTAIYKFIGRSKNTDSLIYTITED